MSRLFWDFVRQGFPVLGAVSAGIWANKRGMGTVSTAGVAAAGWGTGWLAQFLVGKAADALFGETLPAQTASPMGVLPEMATPSVDEAVTQIQQNAEGVVSSVPSYQPDQRGEDGQPKTANLKLVPDGVQPPRKPQAQPPFNPGALGGEGSN